MVDQGNTARGADVSSNVCRQPKDTVHMGLTGYGQGPHTYIYQPFPCLPGGWRTVVFPPGHWQSLCTMPKATQKMTGASSQLELQGLGAYRMPGTQPWGVPTPAPGHLERKYDCVHGCVQLQVSPEGGPRILRGGNLHHSHMGHTHAFNSLKSSVTGNQ